jgi:hypothetical protein
MKVFETHFDDPKKNLLVIVFFGGVYPPIAKKIVSTVLQISAKLLNGQFENSNCPFKRTLL